MERTDCSLLHDRRQRPPSLLLVVMLTLVGTVAAGAVSSAEDEDIVCTFCVHDRVKHTLKIENHPVFEREQLIRDRCTNIELPREFRVAADGTPSSIFEVEHVTKDGCSSTLINPQPAFLDEGWQLLQQPDPEVYGNVEVLASSSATVRFRYTHPTRPPADGQFRVITVALMFFNTADSSFVLGNRFQIYVHRPPVLMVHGLWGSAGTFEAMEKDFQATAYEPAQTYRLDYSPSNDAPFLDNYERVSQEGINPLIQQSADAGLAAGKVDLVGHSMGGILSRLYLQSSEYNKDVRRLVTCNTPHAGSEMADFLLDPSSAAGGLLCKAITSSFGEDKGCTNGAVSNLRVTSLAINPTLNAGIHPVDVQVHALTTVADTEQVRDLILASWAGSGAANPVGFGLLFAGYRSCSPFTLFDEVFKGNLHDTVVALPSQEGGLAGPLTSRYDTIPHVGSVGFQAVIDKVGSLLGEPWENPASFTTAGYDPPILSYTSPSVCGLTPVRAGVLTATTLAITSVSPATTVTAGQQLQVEVTGSTDVATIRLLMSHLSGEVFAAEETGSTVTFRRPVPLQVVGSRRLVAMGLDLSGNVIAVSDPVYVDVEAPATLETITVYPRTIHLELGKTVSLEIEGSYADGISRNLSSTAGLDFTFTQGNASRSGNIGVTLGATGDDTLVVTLNGVRSAEVPVRHLDRPSPNLHRPQIRKRLRPRAF